MKTQILTVALVFSLTACDTFRFDEVADSGGAPLSASLQNAYTMTGSGEIVPRRCLSTNRANLGEVPLGCTVDTVMGGQVSDQRDLIRPVQPGLASIASTNIGQREDDDGGARGPEDAQ